MCAVRVESEGEKEKEKGREKLRPVDSSVTV